MRNCTYFGLSIIWETNFIVVHRICFTEKMAHNIFPPDEIEERFIMSKHACINARYVPSLPIRSCQEPCLLCIYSLKTFKLNINRWSSQEWNHPIVALSQNVYRHILKVTELKKSIEAKIETKKWPFLKYTLESLRRSADVWLSTP